MSHSSQIYQSAFLILIFKRVICKMLLNVYIFGSSSDPNAKVKQSYSFVNPFFHLWIIYFTLTSRDRCIPGVIPIGRLPAHSTAFPNKSESSVTSPADHTIKLSTCLTDNVSMRWRFWCTTVESFSKDKRITV